MTPETLLAELAALTHDDRVRRVIALGQRASSDSDAARVLARFEQRNFYERYLALIACFGSQNGAHAFRALSDSSQQIRSLAIRLVAQLSDDQQVQQALHVVPPNLLTAFLWQLRKRKRQTPIDAFLDDLAVNNDERLGPMLFLGSSTVVNRYFDRVEQSLGYQDWKRLARHHPDQAAERLERHAAGVEQLDNRLVYLANALLPNLADQRPDRALDLVRVLHQHIGLGRLALAQLILRRPASVAALALESDDRLQQTFDQVAHRLDVTQLLALLERRGELVGQRQRWFRRLAPEQRLEVYNLAGRGWQDAEGVLPHWLVALLPGSVRHAEARRHLALPALQTRPLQRLPYAGLLPWEEANATLERFVRNPDPELRVAAQQALALCARYNRGRLPDLLATIRARANEQDPVRLAMIGGLAALPPARWQTTHLADLEHIIRDALNAADLSYATASAMEQLIFNILPFHTTWSATWLATLVQVRGQLSFASLEDRLNNAQMQQIAPLLLPVLRAWANREREQQLVGAAESFGRRLRVFPELSDLLERTLDDTRNSWLAARILRLLAEHRPKRLAELIPRLLRADPSWITQPAVYEFLHRRRQDLLTPFLGQRAYGGRFSTGKTRFVLPFDRGFHRWTPAQQAQFARTLDELTRDPQRDTPTVFRAIHQLGRLPAIVPTRIIELADVRAENRAVRDIAVRTLGRLDGDNGVRPLLDCMADDRARIAIYALRRSLLRMPKAQALELLRSVPLERVTIAKEVVRLIGDLRTEAGYRELLAMSARELHRDIRVALLRALWEHVERDETWPILEAAAKVDDSAIAAGVVVIPADRVSTQARLRIANLLATLLGHPEPAVRIATLKRCATLPIEDVRQQLLAPLVAALGSALPDERNAAAHAVFSTYVGRNAPVVGAAVGAIVPNRRALLVAMEALQRAGQQQRTRLLSTVRVVLDALAVDPLTAELRVSLAITMLPWDELPALMGEMARADELHAGTLQAAQRALAGTVHRSDAAGLSTLETALAIDTNAHLRRVALAALIAQTKDAHGWSDERLQRLSRFRADKAPLVAAAAQFTLPPEDDSRKQNS